MNPKAFLGVQKDIVERWVQMRITWKPAFAKETIQSEADSSAEAATKAPGGCPPSMFCFRDGFLIVSFLSR